MIYLRRFVTALAFLTLCSSAGLGATTYAYDDLGRLIKVTYDNGQQTTYSYDAAGNRTQVSTQAATNSAPTAANDTISTTVNTAVTFDPRTNDTDPDGDTLTITATGSASHGTVAINSGTSLTYTPATNYTGSDSFTYTISDGHSHTATATVSMTVNSGPNQPPTAVNDNVTAISGTPTTFDPRANDNDPDGDPLTITTVGGYAFGTVVINAGTSLTYTSLTGYIGSDTINYTISDGHNHTASATVNVTVVAQNFPPTATNDSITTAVNTAKTFDPRTNDSDPDGDALTITAKTNGAHGTVVINGGGVSLTYTPATNYSGSDSFTYTISDGHSHTATATVSVTVTSGNQPPVANNDSLAIGGNSDAGCVTPGGSLDPRANDSDPEGNTLTITSVTQGAKGGVSITGNGTGVTYTFNNCVSIRHTTDSFTYTISDGHGGTATATVNVQIDVDFSGTQSPSLPPEGGGG